MTHPAHHGTTRHLGAAYPFAAEPGLGAQGALIGRELLGGAFTYDPFDLYAKGVITNPNMVVFGQIGRGKSSFIKTYLWRQAVFGRKAWVIDPKGEYGPLARAWGVEPVSLKPGGRTRLNPLDQTVARGAGAVGSETLAETTRQRAELLVSLASAGLGRTLLPTERTSIELAVTARSRLRGPSPTVPEVVEQMLSPDPGSAEEVHSDPASLAADGRNAALELRRLFAGDLRGMFDGPTSPGIDLAAPFVVLDLSAVYHSAALGILMTCASAWLQTHLVSPDGRGRDTGISTGTPGSQKVIFVVDEAWAILSNLAVAKWLQGAWKLSRARGTSNIAVLHRVSDLMSIGPAGSEHAGLARGLLADSETRVIYGQSPGEIEQAADLLGLSATEGELIPHLGRGTALWKVGKRSFLVHHLLSPEEKDLVDTDSQMLAPHTENLEA